MGRSLDLTKHSGGTSGPSLSFASNVSANEGNSGTTAFVFTLNVARNGYVGAIPFTWAVTGTGANPANAADFVGGALPSGSGAIASGASSANITVNVQGDSTVEPDENFLLTATASFSYAAASTGTIVNDDVASSLTVTPVAGITQDAIPGTVVANITGGSAASLSPNDGRLVLSQDGTKIIKGLSAWSTGTIAVTATPASGGAASATVTVGANPTYTPLVSNSRLSISGTVYDSLANATVKANILASSTNKTKPSFTVAATTTRTISVQVGAHASGAILNYITTSKKCSYAFYYSDDSTDGSPGSGTWTAVTTLSMLTTDGSSNSELTRGQVQPFPAKSTSGRWLRIDVTNGNASGTASVQMGVFAKPSSGDMDLIGVVGMSITINASYAIALENAIKAVDPTRDPIVVCLASPSYPLYLDGTTDYTGAQIPLLASAVTAGVPFKYVFVDPGPNDLNTIGRPYTSGKGATFAAHMDNVRTALASAGFPANCQCWADMDYYNFPSTSAPAVNGFANIDQGTTPFNTNVVGPYYRPAGNGGSLRASYHPGLDAPAGDHSTVTMLCMASGFVDGIAHPGADWYPDVNVKWFPAIRSLSGMPIGNNDLMERVRSVAAVGKTSPYYKTVLTNLFNALPTTSDNVASAIRSQMSAMISGLDTSMAATNLDPSGVTLPSAAGTAPSYWLDPSNLAGATVPNSGNSLRVTAMADRTGVGSAVPSSGGGVFLVPGARNGRPVLRGTTSSYNAATPTGTDGSAFSIGYLALPAGAQSQIDGTGAFTIEFTYADNGDSPNGGYVYGAGAQAGTYGNWYFRAIAGQVIQVNVGNTTNQSVTINAAAVPKQGVMHHYRVSYDGAGNWTVYMDGVSVGTKTFTKGATTNLMGAVCGGGSAMTGGGDLGGFIITQAALNSTDAGTRRTYEQAKLGCP